VINCHDFNTSKREKMKQRRQKGMSTLKIN